MRLGQAKRNINRPKIVITNNRNRKINDLSDDIDVFVKWMLKCDCCWRRMRKPEIASEDARKNNNAEKLPSGGKFMLSKFL